MQRNVFSRWGGFLRFLAREYIPMGCPLCGKEPFDGEDGQFCAECLKEFSFPSLPLCPKCGGTLSGILSQCNDCLSSPEELPWERGFSLFRMEGKVRKMIHRYKYEGRVELARPLGRFAAQKLIDSGVKVDLIVPVPLHFARYLQRGYNQASLLAEEISHHTSIETANLLRRKKWTSRQANLTRNERRKNLSDAFSIRELEKCRSRSILLVDDVMTTGSTLASGARTLLEGGASFVHVLVLARRQRN